jgi:signal peptidase I
MDKQTPFYTVETASMEPTLKIGDKLALKSIFTIVVSKNVRRANPDEISAAPYPDGDIVYAFLWRELPQDREYVLSRVVEKYQAENGTWYLITQADTSESYDPWSPFPLHSVKGKVVAVNPIMPFYFPWFTPLLFVSTMSGGCSCIIMVYIFHKERE